MDLHGKVALVTGGARRVGRALSLALARAGARVIVNYNASRDEALRTVSEIEEGGGAALAIQADVASGQDVRRLVAEAEQSFGRLDVLVNSASIFLSAPVLEIREADWDRVLATNLKGPFLVSQAAAPLLRRDGGGVIVNIADLSAYQAWQRYAHHAVSKAGLVHLTRVLARAFAPDIRVNCIAPGTVLPPEDTPPAELDRDRKRTPLGRLGNPDDVVRALLFLVQSDFVTGEILVVDGGRLLT